MATTPAAATTTRGLERWAALGGVLYVVRFIIGTLLEYSGAPEGDAAPVSACSSSSGF